MIQPDRTRLAPDLSISRVVMGLWQIADMERGGTLLDAAAGAASMKEYADAGFTTFDMADHYGSAEVIAGTFGGKYGKAAGEMMTKWVPEPGPVSKETVRKAVHRALERLSTERISLLQFHAWNYADPRWLDCLFFLSELQKEGLIAHMGLTNFDTAHLRIALTSGINVVSNQVCYSLLDQRASGAMTQLCHEHNVGLLAFGTLAGGFLSGRWLGKPEPTDKDLVTWSQMKYKRFIDTAGGWSAFQELLSTLDVIAIRHGSTIAHVAARYVMDQPAVAGVIIGARLGQSHHAEENKKLLALTLDPSEQSVIHSALSRLKSIPGDCGDEYRRPPFLTASGDLSHHIATMPAPYPVTDLGNGRSKALSGTIWEDLAGFSRAVRTGDQIFVSGTTATHGHVDIGGSDPAAQAHFVIDKLEGAIQSLGGRLEDVVRTRIFMKNMNDWEVISRVHGERFRNIQPANTLVRADLVGDNYLLEMEADAVVGSKS